MKDIKSYEGIYKIDEKGNIFSVRSDRFIKTSLKRNGYVYVELNVKSKVKYYRVHRLVAETFIPNPLNKPFVNHINGIKHDNRIENLEWCTGTENNIHAFEIGTATPRYNYYEIYKDNMFICNCIGMVEVLRVVGYKSKTSITSCVKENRPTQTGYIVKRIERATTR